MLALLSRRVLTLYALICLLLSVTLLIGTTIPIPPHTSLFSKSICALPCVYRLTPGVSTRDQARQTFTPSALSLSLINEDQPAYILRQTADSSLLADIDFGSATSQTVRSVELFPLSATFALGTLSDFMLAGYLPSRVLSSCYGDILIITLGAGDEYIEVARADGLAPNTVIRLLGTTVRSDEALTHSLDQFACASEQRWTGFAAAWKYA